MKLNDIWICLGLSMVLVRGAQAAQRRADG